MKVETNVKEPCVVALSVSADAEEIKDDYKAVFGSFVKNAVVPGFRKGKAPVDVIKRKFQSEITDEVTQACIRKYYPKAIAEAKLDPINFQGIAEAFFTPETGIKFTAVVEVKPEFSVPKYKKLSIKKNEVSVTDAQVSERIESYRTAFAKYEDAKEDSVVTDGDFVNFNYKGSLKGQPLAEIVPDQKAVTGAENFWTQVEEGRFLPEILAALKGMKAGETKTGIKVKFPKDNAPEAICGKTCEYEITLNSFRCRVLPDDKTFFEAAKVESLEALQKQFRADMEKAADDAELENRRNQAVELLLKKADFGVPPCLVSQQMERILREIAQRAQYSGLPADYFEKNRDSILADANSNAVRQVRISYILDAIADAENIEISDDEVNKGVEKMAASMNGSLSAEDFMKRLEESGRRDAFVEQLRAEKALDLILAEAK